MSDVLSQMDKEELDLLIHIKVMNGSSLCSGKVQKIRRGGKHYKCLECGATAYPENDSHVRKIPAYSTSMDAAWLVAQRVTERVGGYNTFSKVSFMAWWAQIDIWSMPAQEAASAICNKALELTIHEQESVVQREVQG